VVVCEWFCCGCCGAARVLRPTATWGFRCPMHRHCVVGVCVCFCLGSAWWSSRDGRRVVWWASVWVLSLSLSLCLLSFAYLCLLLLYLVSLSPSLSFLRRFLFYVYTFYSKGPTWAQADYAVEQVVLASKWQRVLTCNQVLRLVRKYET
jgi:hypothetical protein